MTTRNRRPINFIYLHVDLTDSKSTTALQELATKHEAERDVKLGVTSNIANTEAIVKVEAADDWVTGRSWKRDFVKRVYTEREHGLVKDIVRAPGFWPTIEVI